MPLCFAPLLHTPFSFLTSKGYSVLSGPHREIGSQRGQKADPKEHVLRSRCYQHTGRTLRGASAEHLSSQTSLRGISPALCMNL